MNGIKYKIWSFKSKEWCNDLNIFVNQEGKLVYHKCNKTSFYLNDDDYDVCYSIGMNDLFGNDVYYGDILLFNKLDKLLVVHGVYMRHLVDKYKCISGDTLKIIGNIYENPELVNSSFPFME